MSPGALERESVSEIVFVRGIWTLYVSETRDIVYIRIRHWNIIYYCYYHYGIYTRLQHSLNYIIILYLLYLFFFVEGNLERHCHNNKVELCLKKIKSNVYYNIM